MGKRKQMPGADWQRLVDELRQHREKQGLSQSQLTQDIGYLGAHAIYEWEKQRSIPSVAGFLLWVEELGLRVELVANELGS